MFFCDRRSSTAPLGDMAVEGVGHAFPGLGRKTLAGPHRVEPVCALPYCREAALDISDAPPEGNVDNRACPHPLCLDAERQEREGAWGRLHTVDSDRACLPCRARGEGVLKGAPLCDTGSSSGDIALFHVSTAGFKEVQGGQRKGKGALRGVAGNLGPRGSP